MKVRKILTLSGANIILGKDAESNDELMEKFKGEKNTILHTVASGSPFCVIDTPLKPVNKDIIASGAICSRYSRDWRDNKKDVKVNVFTGKDVNKTKGMKVGTWKVKKSKIKIIKKEDIIKV
jgi:predicted ribosome quality control (RQC) complex YloA/Tae2 family protein